MWTKEKLWELRQEIKLGSLFIADYRNSFGVAPHKVCDFFDGFLEFVGEEMQVDCSSYDDAAFWNLRPDYDTPEYLLDWYSCFEEDPLAADDEEDKDDD